MSVPGEGTRSRDRRIAYRTQFEATEIESVAVAVSQALAAARGEDTSDSRQLYEYVDPDALALLADHASRRDEVAWKVEFAAGEFDVTVSSDGWITVA
jgi:hypothetical protein